MKTQQAKFEESTEDNEKLMKAQQAKFEELSKKVQEGGNNEKNLKLNTNEGMTC